MKKYDVISSGYVSMDRVIKIGSPAEISKTSIVTNTDNAEIKFGGCSTNICYSLAKLGKKSLPIVRIGQNDFVQTGYHEYFQKAGVCMDLTSIIPNEATSNCYLILDENRNHITLFYPGAMDGKYAKDIPDEYFKQSKLGLLTIGSYEDNCEFLRKCKANNLPLVFGMKTDYDGFPKELLKEILLYSTIIFTNEAECKEIEELFGFDSITDLFKLGNAKIIVTTLGKKGSKFYDMTKDTLIKGVVTAAELGDVIDTTGSGDAYIAGFIYAYLNGETIEDCCNYGSVMSSFIIEKIGSITGSPTKQELDNRYDLLINKE